MKPSSLVFLLFYFILNIFLKCNCSTIYRQLETYIEDSKKVDIGSYPWIVSISYGNHGHICGGSIITTTNVITAAQCTRDFIASSFKIRAGSSSAYAGGQLISVTKYVSHPMYSEKTVQNDISILFLESELKMSIKVSVISLPDQDDFLAEGTDLQVAGWGRISEHGNLSEFLLAIKIQAVEHKRCVEIYQIINEITDSMMCAGVASGKNSPCYGDSGGPLSYNKTLTGIVSWGVGCAIKGKPIVFTRVASFTDWINSHLDTDL